MIMVRRKKPRIDAARKVPRSRDVFVTQAMLYGVRDELKAHLDSKVSGVESKISGLDSKIFGVDSKISGFDSRFASLDSKISGFDSRFASLDSKISRFDSKFSDLKSEIHRLAILMEEQNARNIIVLDGLANLFERQERIEQRENDR